MRSSNRPPHAMGAIDLDELRRESTAWEERRASDRLGRFHRFTQRHLHHSRDGRLERDNLDLMGAGRGQNLPIAAAEEIRRGRRAEDCPPIKSRSRNLVLTAPDWLTSIEGRAGSAKTTTVGAIREFAEEHGYAVRGFAPTTRAVKALSEAGVESRTVASLIERKSPMPAVRNYGSSMSRACSRHARSTASFTRPARPASNGSSSSATSISTTRSRRDDPSTRCSRPVCRSRGWTRFAASGTRYCAKQLSSRPKERSISALALLEQHDCIREISNPDVRYKSIAHEYVAAHEAGEQVLVVSPANDERRQLELRHSRAPEAACPYSAEGKEQTCSSSATSPGAQRQRAQSYEVGDVVRYRRGSRRLGLDRALTQESRATDPYLNRITVRTKTAEQSNYNPARLTGVESFREERASSPRRPDPVPRTRPRARRRERRVCEGRRIDDRKAALRMDNGREVKAAVSRLRHIDYGYASTSHSSQGATVDRVIVNIDTARSAELVNRKQFYVSISRARHAVTIYTDDSSALRHAVGRTREKSIALERLNLNVGRDLKIIPEPQRQNITPAHGIRR